MEFKIGKTWSLLLFWCLILGTDFNVSVPRIRPWNRNIMLNPIVEILCRHVRLNLSYRRDQSKNSKGHNNNKHDICFILLFDDQYQWALWHLWCPQSWYYLQGASFRHFSVLNDNRDDRFRIFHRWDLNSKFEYSLVLLLSLFFNVILMLFAKIVE